MRQLFTPYFLPKKLLVFAALAFTTISFAQSPSLHKVYEWTTFFENDYVRIDYKYGTCDLKSEGTHKEEVYLQFTNKTPESISLAWALELHYGKKCFNCDGENKEMSYSLDLAANETKSGECQEAADQRLVLFSKHLDFESPLVLSQFLIKDLEKTNVK